MEQDSVVVRIKPKSQTSVVPNKRVVPVPQEGILRVYYGNGEVVFVEVKE